MTKISKISSVEGLRGWASFTVLISHLSLVYFPYLHAFRGKADPQVNSIQAWVHESPFGFFYSGTSAVYVFFVLSGFILSKVSLRKADKFGNVVSMMWRRYPRLMLPAVASCVIAYWVAFVGGGDVTDLSYWIQKYLANFEGYSFGGAIYSGVFEVFFGAGKSAYNPVLWTMQIELFGSFLIFLLCYNRLNAMIPWLASLVIICLLVLNYSGVVSSNFSLGGAAFVGGYLIAIYGNYVRLPISLSCMLVGLYLAGAHNGSASYTYIYQLLGGQTYKICNFISGFFLVYAVVFSRTLGSILSTDISMYLGRLSFSVYLVQMPILALIGGRTFQFFYDVCGNYNVAALGSSFVLIVLVYWIAHLFYECVDKRAIQFSKIFSSESVAKK